jgi:hypothetical protein
MFFARPGKVRVVVPVSLETGLYSSFIFRDLAALIEVQAPHMYRVFHEIKFRPDRLAHKVSRKSATIFGQGTIPELSTSHIGKGVALVARAAAFVYIYARIPQIAEMTLKLPRNIRRSVFSGIASRSSTLGTWLLVANGADPRTNSTSLASMPASQWAIARV